MKKLLSIALIGAALGTSAFAGGFSNSWKQEKILSVQVKHVDISDSGLNSGTVYGLSYVIHKELGEPGAWGMRYGFEFDYGKLDNKNSSGNTTYTEFSWEIAPSYTFNCGVRAYAGGKIGYAGFSDSVTSSNGTNGYVLAGIAGVEYSVKKHFVVGAEAEVGSTYIDTESYSTTTFGGYVGYKF